MDSGSPGILVTSGVFALLGSEGFPIWDCDSRCGSLGFDGVIFLVFD